MPGLSIAVGIQDGANGPVDGKLLPADTKATDLSVEVREVPALKQRVVAEANTSDDMSGTKCNLLHLWEILRHGTVQYHLPDTVESDFLHRPDLGGIQRVEGELVLVSLGDDLYIEVPFGIDVGLDSFL